MASSSTKVPYILPADAVWFITGCSSGLGLALAQLIAAHPTHRLVATARNPSAKLKEMILSSSSPSSSSSSRVLILPLDVTSSNESITAALGTVLAHPDFGRIDVLVNNAGYGLTGDTESSLLPEEHAKARAVLDTNFWGVAKLTLNAMRIMRDDNARSGQQGGLIVQVTSMGGFMGFPGNSYYHASKFAVEGFTEGVSREVRPEWNIHFTIAEPGGIATNYISSSMIKLANHPAYDAPDSPTRMMISYSEDPEFHKTWAKPENMAKAIYEVTSRGKPIPMRFPLGKMAWEVLRTEVDTLAKEFDEIKDLSLSVETGDLEDEREEHIGRIQQIVKE